MVVLAASIISKSGKALVSRQFVDMSRVRIEALLAAFPKLVESEKQHTYVETKDVRYVYQPIEGLYLLFVTNKQSNILDDLNTLRLLSKVVAEFSTSLDEEGICKYAFELIFAFDEVISNGHKEDVTVAQVKQYCEMESHEERLHKAELQSKIDETRKEMQRRAREIEKNKQLERAKMVKGGYSSLQSMGIVDGGFGNETVIPDGNNYGRGSGIGLSTDVNKSKAVSAPGRGTGMKLGKSQKGDQFLR